MTDDTLHDVVEFYSGTDEDLRLEAGPFQLEFVRTQELLRRLLPPAPARVLDVGGGSGPYAFWLSGLGYEVHLVDLTPRLVEMARRRNMKGARLASIDVGDARGLRHDDQSFDAVLMLGPLYHLTSAAGRHTALQEAHRVLRPAGVVFAAAISRYAGTLDGISLNPTAADEIVALRDRALRDGQYRNDTGDPRYFVTAYFHRPSDLSTELEAADFSAVRIFGIEGPGWLVPDFDVRWAEPAQKERLLAVARLLEEEASIVGASAHLLAFGKRS